MANMSYCRFRNTLGDLIDCEESIWETEDLSEEEARARRGLIKMCHRIAEDTKEEYEEMSQ